MNRHRDDIEELMRLVGAPAAMDPRRAERVKDQVMVAWQASVRANKLRRWRRLGRLIAAVFMVSAVSMVFWEREGRPLPGRRLVTVASVAGPVFRGSPETGSASAPIIMGQTLQRDTLLQSRTGGGAGLVSTSGVRVRMGAQTQLSFLGGDTWMLQSGKIYVTTDAAKKAVKLTVRTPHGSLNNLGTRFEVDVRDEGTRVRVRQGEIVMHWASRREHVAAGQGLWVETNGQMQRESIEPYGDSWAWSLPFGPGFASEQPTLEALLDWVGAETGRAIGFEEPALADQLLPTRLHGDLANLSPYEALETVLPTCDLAYQIVAGRIILRDARPIAPIENP